MKVIIAKGDHLKFTMRADDPKLPQEILTAINQGRIQGIFTSGVRVHVPSYSDLRIYRPDDSPELVRYIEKRGKLSGVHDRIILARLRFAGEAR